MKPVWGIDAPYRFLILFVDEIDSLVDDTLIAVLRQLREGYPARPQRFPHSVALIGMRDVRDYKARIRPNSETLGTASPSSKSSAGPTVAGLPGMNMVDSSPTSS